MLIEAKHTTDEARRFELLRDAGRLRLERLDEAITAVGPLSEAMELRPTDHDLTLLMAQAYTAAGMIQEAVDLLEAAISRRSGRRSRELATLQHRMANVAGTRQSQLQWLFAAFESDPKNPEVCAELTDLAMELKDYETALKALRVLVSMKELSARVRGTAYLKQAEIAVLQGDEKKALFLAKKAHAEDGSLVEAGELVERLGGRK
jgi:tetratricopeptide (TPR) repeat protein